ncbi:hypothetical protein ACJMK2_008425 [Sinanodonta woodiana]|uniref:Uncharacterized protein n=1 Tax=Sinanodonta woodiana TaxID=1069815 RepID=A0ABD3VLJ6_SINWO
MDVDNDLQCPICLELYTYPIILPCSHVLCRRPCAEQLFDYNFIKCPVCRDNCYVSGGISSLPRVIALENIIERYKAERIKNRNNCESGKSSLDISTELIKEPESIGNIIYCQSCDSSHPKKAKKTCLDCYQSFCGPCLRSSHPNKAPYISHELIEPVPLVSREQHLVGTCSEHSKTVLSYCLLCKQPMCTSCEDQEVHEGHAAVQVNEAYRDFKNTLEEGASNLESSRGKLMTNLKQQKDALKNMQQFINRRRDEINMQCDTLLAEIENKRNFFLSDLEYEERVRQNEMEDVIKTLEKLLGSTQGLHNYVQEVLNNDQASFLEIASTLNDRVVKAILDSESIAIKEFDREVLKSKVVDCRKEKNILRDLHYLSSPATPIVDVSHCSRSEDTVILALSMSNISQDVVDQYEIHFCSEAQKNLEIEETLIIKNTPEDRVNGCKGFVSSTGMLMILVENLCRSTTYYFCLSGSNTAGKSASSEVIQCTTLQQEENVVPAPSIIETLCKHYPTSVQIYSSSPLDIAPEQQISHFLLYRPASQTRTWRSIPIYGRQEHRVFGLEPSTEYEFVILACNIRGECQLSNKVIFQTEQGDNFVQD